MLFELAVMMQPTMESKTMYSSKSISKNTRERARNLEEVTILRSILTMMKGYVI